jgi:serine/threonine-protein kinase
MNELQALNAALTGRYEIERPIGAGGMAVVYLARDLRHKRQVAIKVLNPDLAAVIGTERFLAEIEVTASLHHPHLLPLFDSGAGEGVLWYAMPYVQGETLRHRLTSERQLPVDEAVRIATAIGGALDHAHRHGVIHRDLKPENVLIQDGQPLVMDFGIALAVSNAGGTRITQSGISLGTPHYMSPEQATGSEHLDARSDIYSLGAMLYEMLVGDPPHTGSTIQAVIARVLSEKAPSARETREAVPAHVDAAIRRALSKLPADRFATAGEFTAAVASTGSFAATATAAPAIGSRPSFSRRQVATWSGAIVGAAALGAVTTAAFRPDELPHAAQFAVALPDTTTIPSIGRAVAVSSDGAWLALAGSSGPRAQQLHLRPMTEMKYQVVRGTESAESPSFSPDNSEVMFASRGRLLKVPVRGGNVLTIADSGSAQASWGETNVVMFARAGALYLVPSAGGAPRLLARPDSASGQVALGWPAFLPGGEHALVTVWKGAVRNDSAWLAVVDASDGEVRELGVRGTGPRFASGHALFADAARRLWAAPYSPGKASLSGEPVLLAEHVSVDSSGAADIAASAGGLVLYSESASQAPRRSGAAGGNVRETSSLVITDSTGTVRSVSVQREPFYMPRVSPDGSRIAVVSGARMSGGTLDGEIWVYDVGNGTLSRLTQGAAVTRPEWDAAGRRIAYRPLQWQSASFVSQPWDRSGTSSPITGTQATLSMSWGTVGRYIAVERRVTVPNHDLWLVPRSGGSPIPIDTTEAHEVLPRLSPDERWVAYLSNEGGRQQVYVRPVPGPGARVPVSIGGGEAPVWSRDSRTLYYIEGDRLLAARVSETPSFAVARRDTLADVGTFLVAPGLNTVNYDVFPGGGFVFLGAGAITTGNRQNVIAVVDWTRKVRSR